MWKMLVELIDFAPIAVKMVWPDSRWQLWVGAWKHRKNPNRVSDFYDLGAVRYEPRSSIILHKSEIPSAGISDVIKSIIQKVRS